MFVGFGKEEEDMFRQFVVQEDIETAHGEVVEKTEKIDADGSGGGKEIHKF